MECAIDLTKHYTYADYLTWLDGKMRELVDGVVKLFAPAAGSLHQKISMSMGANLFTYIQKFQGHCQVFAAPFDVRLSRQGKTADEEITTVVQPDICVVCDPSKIDARGCLGVPDMVVEIQSPSTAHYDLTEKYNLYESVGVPEYWVVYPQEAIDVFLLRDGKYERHFYQYDADVPVQALEGCIIKLKEIFK